MRDIDEVSVLRRLLASRFEDPAPEEAWMSVARAISTMSESPQGSADAALRLAGSYLDDGSTADMLDDLERAQEEVLGVIPMDDGREYFVFSRMQRGGFMDFSAVYLMSTQFVVFGIYRTEISGIFRKKLRITALRESKRPHELCCSDLESIRFVGSMERLVSSVMNAGRLHSIFPDGAVPAFALSHWWLPLRKWMH